MPVTPGTVTATPGTSTSAIEIIKKALRMIKVLAPGEEPTGAEGADALIDLNQMIDGWNAEQLMIYTTNIQEFPFTPGKQVYTLGPAGDWDTARPARLWGVSVVILANPSAPLEIPIDMLRDDEWQEKYPIKNIASTFPLSVYDDGAFPQRNLSFWPSPVDQNDVRLYGWGALSQFADLTTVYSFPPAYLEAIKYNLALRLSDEWGGDLGQTIVAGAVASLARIKTMNVPIETLKCDQAVLSGTQSNAKARAHLFNLPY